MYSHQRIENSSFITFASYQGGILGVEIGHKWYYYRVGRKRAYNRLVNAKSVGAHFNKVIKKFYQKAVAI
jgi:hypothetical protein